MLYNEAYEKPETGVIFDYIEEYLEENLRRTAFLKDSIESILNYKNNNLKKAIDIDMPGMEDIPTHEVDVYYKDLTQYSTIQGVGPLSHVEWDQGAPYNKTVNEIFANSLIPIDCAKENKMPAGCVPIMIAQVMSYYSYPTSLLGLNLDWKLLNRYSGMENYYRSYKNTTRISDAPSFVRSSIANLICQIGSEANVTYGCKGSSADYEKDGLRVLKKMGFKVDSPRAYDWNYIKSSLDQSRIITANGKSEKKNWFLFNTYEGGHAWVIDGYIQQSKIVEMRIEHYDYY